MPLTAQAAARKDRNSPLSVDLQHRHFAFIAATLHDMKWKMEEWGADPWVVAVEAFADACAKTNPKFDRARFLAACNV